MNQEITLLFAVEAEQLMLTGDIEQAIDLLKKGMEKFPDYTAARIILEKAYSLLEESKNDSNFDSDETVSENDSNFDSDESINISDESIEIEELSEIENPEEQAIIDDINTVEVEESSFLTQDEKNEDPEPATQSVLEGKEDEEEFALENSFEEDESIIEESVIENSDEINDENEINLDFASDDEKLFSEEEKAFDIDEFIRQNSLQIEKEKELISNEKISFEKELIKLPSLNHLFKNFVYKPIIIQYTEHLKCIDNLFNLDDDKKIIELHFLSKKLSSEPYVNRIFSEENADSTSTFNENEGFASETIAKIYQQQGAFKEAVEAYSQLMISDPSKKEYYQSEIDKIKGQ